MINHILINKAKLLEWLADRLCNIETADKYLCENIIFVLTGPSSNINITRVPVYTTHEVLKQTIYIKFDYYLNF
jgi:hypothetical protein